MCSCQSRGTASPKSNGPRKSEESRHKDRYSVRNVRWIRDMIAVRRDRSHSPGTPKRPWGRAARSGFAAASHLCPLVLAHGLLVRVTRFGFRSSTRRPQIPFWKGRVMASRDHAPNTCAPDDRYPYVYHDRATWGRIGVSVARGDDCVWVTASSRAFAPAGRWQLRPDEQLMRPNS